LRNQGTTVYATKAFALPAASVTTLAVASAVKNKQILKLRRASQKEN